MRKIISMVFFSIILLTGISMARVNDLVGSDWIPNCDFCRKGLHNRCLERTLSANPGSDHNPNCCCTRMVIFDDGENKEHNSNGWCNLRYCKKSYCTECGHICESLCKFAEETNVKCYNERGDGRYCEKHTCKEENCSERVYFLNENLSFCYKHICFNCLGKNNKSASLNNLCDVCRYCEHGLHEFSESGECKTPKTCIICNQVIENSHNYIWEYEGNLHYKVCQYCGETSEKEEHTLNIESYVNDNNITRKECICGYYENEEGKFSIRLNRIEIFLTKDKKETISVSKWKNDNEHIRHIEGEECTWGSSNKKVATVDNSGTVTGVGCGTAYISAVYQNGLTASCKVVVRDCTITKVEFEKYDDVYHIKKEICKNGCLTCSYVEHDFNKLKVCKGCSQYNCLHENTRKEGCITLCDYCKKIMKYEHYDGCPCEEGVPGKPKKVKTLVIYIDPIITDEAGNILYKENGEPLRYSDYKGLDRNEQLELYMSVLNNAAPGIINYDIVGNESVDGFDDFAKLTHQGGTVDFTQDVTLSLDWLESSKLKGDRYGYFSYDLLSEMYNLDERKLAGEFDEVIIVGTDESGAWESTGANWGATTGYIGSEDGFKTTFVNMNNMGGTECYGHSLEYLFNEVFKPVMSNPLDGYSLGYDSGGVIKMDEETYNSLSDWEKFCLNRVNIEDGNGEIWAGPGSIHFSPNSQDDYNWSSEETTYYRDPKTGEVVPFSSSIYTENPYYQNTSDDMALHHAWWFSQLPTGEGRDEDGYSRDWWVYAQSCDFVDKVTGGSYEMLPGDSKSISFNLIYKSGKEENYSVKGYEEYVYVSNPSVASFSGGKLVAKKEGTCVVTLKYDGREGSVSITVDSNKCANPEHFKDAMTIRMNDEKHIKYGDCSTCGFFEIEEIHDFSIKGECICGMKTAKCLNCGNEAELNYGLCNLCILRCEHKVINNNICEACGVFKCLNCGKITNELYSELCSDCLADKCSKAGHDYTWTYASSEGENTHVARASCMVCNYTELTASYKHIIINDVCKICGYDKNEKNENKKCNDNYIIEEHKVFYKEKASQTTYRTVDSFTFIATKKIMYCSKCEVDIIIRESESASKLCEHGSYREVCSLCGEQKCEHIITKIVKLNNNEHQVQCITCEEKVNTEKHQYNNGVCDVCGYKK